MQRAVFFSGLGTVYSKDCTGKGEIELYTQTLPALRFLQRRGYLLVLVTSERQEYRHFLSLLKDRALPVLHFLQGEDELGSFATAKDIDLSQSFYVTDGHYLKPFTNSECRLILVLSGQGFETLAGLNKKDLDNLHDVCKDVYAAAFSLALL